MQVDVVIEQRFYRCSAGYFWTDNAFPYDFWKRYLADYQQVNVVARVKENADISPSWKRVDGDGVQFVPLPYYVGPKEFLTQILPTLKIASSRKKVKDKRVIYRVPGILAYLYHLACRPKTYGAEVVGDPEDTFSASASASRIRALIQWIFVNLLKKQCFGASSISYVTKETLQKKYPPNPKAFSTHYSSIQLREEDFKNPDLSSCPDMDTVQLICIGNLSQPYKGCDFMLRCLKQLNISGPKYRLNWVGGGALLPDMVQLAKDLGVTQYVDFKGNVSQRDEINQMIDQADMFVLASRQEGLPRVMIESMARGKICVGTDVGGVRELIDSQFVVPRDDEHLMVTAIKNVANMSPEERNKLQRLNYLNSLSYSEQELEKRRRSMYQNLQVAAEV